MSPNNAYGVSAKTACPVNPARYPRNVFRVVRFVRDVTIIDEQAPKPHAGLFQMLAKLLKAVI
jgi:hypothetical protein